MRSAFLLALLLPSIVSGQIVGPSDVPPGTPIKLTMTLAEGEKAAWIAEPGAAVVKFNRDSVYAWGTQGQANVVNGFKILADDTVQAYQHTFRIGDKPDPVVKTLRELAGDKAPALAAMYADFSAAVKAKAIDSAAVFKLVHADRLTALGLVGHGATARIDEALAVVLVDPWNADAVASVLDAFVAELGSLPPPDVDPTPPPSPAPIPEPGLRVLIIYDADTKGALPREQLALIDSPSLRAYLDQHCTKADGVPEWRIAPDAMEFNDDQPIWKRAMSLPRGGLPWLIVSNGTAGESIPLPANEAAALEVIGRYAK